MVRIRLSRTGRKNAPKYRVMVANSRTHVTKKGIEVVGFFNPLARGKEPRLYLDLVRIQEWIQKGAQPTDRVRALIKEFEKQQAATQ